MGGALPSRPASEQFANLALPPPRTSEVLDQQLKAVGTPGSFSQDQLQVVESIQQKIRKLESLEQRQHQLEQQHLSHLADARQKSLIIEMRQKALSTDMRQKAGERAPRLATVQSNAARQNSVDLKARAAARLAAMGVSRENAGTAQYSQRGRQPEYIQLDSRWAEEEIVFKPTIEDDNEAICVLDWPATAASAVGEAIRGLSPRRESSPLRFLAPAMDRWDSALCSGRNKFPTRADKRSI